MVSFFKWCSVPYTLMTLLLLQSCITDQKLIRQYERSTASRAYPAEPFTGGVFSNIGLDSSVDCLLYFIANSRKGSFNSDTNQPNAYLPETLLATAVRMHFDGKESLSLEILDSVRRRKPLKLRVKDKGRYLSVRRKTLLIPVPGFFAYSNYKMLLLAFGDHLVAISGRASFAEVLVVIPVYRMFYSLQTFKRLPLRSP